MTEKPQTVVIPKEQAVFWLDSEGWWRNAGGKFRKKKIIDYFHKSIGRDENGYFLIHDKGEKWEKIYFPYEDTALFVFDIREDKQETGNVVLILNTGRKIPLVPENLWIRNDSLYITRENEKIKFAERALMKISKLITEDKNGRLAIKTGGRFHVISEK